MYCFPGAPSSIVLCMISQPEHRKWAILKLCSKLSQRISILKKVRSCLPMQQRLLYYNAMIRSIMYYASTVWSSCDKDNLGRVFKLQKRAARVICNAHCQESSFLWRSQNSKMLSCIQKNQWQSSSISRRSFNIK